MDKEFTPETLRECAMQLEKERFSWLMDIDDAGAAPMAEQYYLLALGAIEQARRFFQMAELEQVKALAGGLRQ